MNNYMKYNFYKERQKDILIIYKIYIVYKKCI